MSTVKGTFAVENLASGPLRDMRTEARSTQQAFRDLGQEMSRVGSDRANLDAYRNALRSLRDDAQDSMADVRAQWDQTSRNVTQNVASMRADIDALGEKLDSLDKKRPRPTIELGGVDESIAKIELLEAKLDELDRKRARPSVSLSSSGGAGQPSAGASMEQLTHEMIALRAWQRSNPNFWNEGGVARAATSGGGAAGLGAIGGAVSGAGGAAESLTEGIPALGAKAAIALPAISSLAGATGALVSSMTGAALGTGALALAGGGSLAMGLGAIAAVAMPTVKRLQEAWQAAEQYRQAITEAQMPGEQQTQQMRAVVQAENQLQQAQEQSRLAQIALTEARREARNELVNLRLATQQTALGEKQAQLQLTMARRSLYQTETSPTATPVEVEQAKLQVAQSELGIRQSRQQAKEAREKASIAQYQTAHGGVVSVQSAQMAAQQALLGIRNARWALEQAKFAASGGQAAEQARLQQQYALSFLPPGSGAIIGELQRFMESWRHQPATATVTGMIGGTLSTLSGMAPTLERGAAIAAAGLAQAGESFGKWLSSPATQSFMITGSQMFAENITTGGHVLENILTTLQHIMVAFRPFLKEIGETFARWTAGWAKGTANIASTRQHLAGMVDDMKKWTDMWLQFWSLLHSIMVAGGANQMGNSILESFTNDMKRWEDWVKTNPQKVRDFFRETIEGARTLWHIFENITSALLELARAFGPVLKGAGGLIGLASEAGILGSPLGLAGLIVGRRAIGRLGQGGGTSTASAGAGLMTLGASAGMGARSEASYVARSRALSTTPRFYAPPASSIATEYLAGYSGTGAIERGTLPDLLGKAESKLKAFGERIADVGESAGEAIAPFVLLQGGLELAGGRNPLSNPVQAALMGGSLPLMFGGGWKAGLFGAGLGLGASGIASAAEHGTTRQSIITSALGGAIQGGALGAQLAPESLGLSIPIGIGLGAIANVGGSLIAGLFGGGGPSKREQEAELMAKQNQKVQLSTEKMAAAWNRARSETQIASMGMQRAVEHGVRPMEEYTQNYLKMLREEYGPTSEKTKELTIATWAASAEAVEKRAAEMGHWTSTMIEAVNRSLINELRAMGVEINMGPKGGPKEMGLLHTLVSMNTPGEEVTGYAHAGAPAAKTPPAPSRGAGGATGVHATGGRLAGWGTSDSITTPYGRVAPGELVVNRHTEAEVDRDLIAAGKRPLGSRVSTQTVPHSYPVHYATGGRVLSEFASQYGGTHMARLLAAMDRVSAANFPYKWGGGHEEPARFEPFDCSGAVSYVVQQAGYDVPTTVSGDIGQWGFPSGRGLVTIFYNPVHTWMMAAGHGWGTSGFARPGTGGAGWFDQTPSASYEAGFSTVHLPDLGETGIWHGGAGVFENRGQQLIDLGIGPAAKAFAAAAGASSTGGMLPAFTLRVPQLRQAGLFPAVANAALATYARLLERKYGAATTVAGHGGSPSANEALGRRMMIASGFPASEWPFLQQLWQKESGWSSTAVNPESGAAGIAQSLGHGPVPLGNARAQIAWGLNYIRERYGTPRAAWAHEQADNWYGRGGRLGFAGAFAKGGSFTTRPNQPVAFIAGEGPHSEDVQIRPRKPGLFSNQTGGHSIQITNVVHVGAGADRKAIEEAVEEASARSARDLLAALDRHEERQMLGLVQD